MSPMLSDRTKAICGGKSCGGDFEFPVQNVSPLRVFLLLCSSVFSLMLSPLRWSVEPPIHYFPPNAFPPSISLNHFNSAWHCISFSPQLVSCENFTNWLRVIKLCPILPITTKRSKMVLSFFNNFINFASKSIHVVKKLWNFPGDFVILLRSATEQITTWRWRGIWFIHTSFGGRERIKSERGRDWNILKLNILSNRRSTAKSLEDINLSHVDQSSHSPPHQHCRKIENFRPNCNV